VDLTDATIERVAPALMVGPTLGALSQYLAAADSVARDRDDEAAADRLQEMLATVEDVLGRLAGEESIDGSTARRLFILRDDVSAQLLAAATLQKIELPSDAVLAVLLKAAESTRAGLDRQLSSAGCSGSVGWPIGSTVA